MKPLRVDRSKSERRPRKPYPHPTRQTPKRPKKTRKRRGWFSHMVEEIWDELEDIFD
jgi:hypothetical protein